MGPLVSGLDTGFLTLPDDVALNAVRAHEGALWWCLELEQRLLDIEEWLEDAGGIEHLVLKGPAVAHLDDVDPSLRSFGDLDLLIAGHDLDRALDVLAHHGARRASVARRPGFDRRFGKGVGTRSEDGVEIDVHRALCGGAHGFRIPLDRLFDHAEHFSLGGRSIPTLSRPHRALHACYHAVVSSSEPPLRTPRDLGWYLSSEDLTPEVLAPEAARWRGEVVLAEAVRSTVTMFGLDLPEWQAWLNANPVPGEEHRILEVGRRPSGAPFHWSTVRELPWRDRVAFLWAVAVPSSEVLEARGQTHLSRLSTALKRLAR
ncbi:MAG: nucleotidyltransferase family protein [Acidimicrobiales bacterium]|nr:nucleotidyltransferase family protein [Acidimicrobiales bacterium]